MKIRIIFLFYLSVLIIVSCEPKLGPDYRTTCLKSNTVGKIFIKSVNWGITGDKQLTIITTDKKTDVWRASEDENYIYDGLEPFTYRQSNDSLIIYSHSAVSVPKHFKSRWKIIQHKVENSFMMDLYTDKRYKHP